MSTAGNEPSERIEKPPGEIESSSWQVVKDVSGTDQRGAFAYSVKALGFAGDSKKELEKIKKQYQRRNQAVIEKENIPEKYRQVIRDYFLSIGLEKEQPDEQTPGSKDS